MEKAGLIITGLFLLLLSMEVSFTGNGINYNGGRFAGRSRHVYLIWYGNWDNTASASTAKHQHLVNSFLAGLSGSGYEQINTTMVTR